jgi:hypothetical protein
MDPHKVPPQGLKDIFKELRSIKDKQDPRMAAHAILDLSNDSSTKSAERARFLGKTFDCFNSQTPVSHPAMLRDPLSPADAEFYTVGGVPGRHTHSFI